MIMSTLAFEITSSFLFSSMIYCNRSIKRIRTCSKEQEDVEIETLFRNSDNPRPKLTLSQL